MQSVVLVIHLILALAIIGLILIQRSEGGGLGIGGSKGGGMGGLASARGTANALTRMTALCAAGFFITSLTLGVLASQHSRQSAGILNTIPTSEIESPVTDNNEVTAPVGITYTPPEEIPALNVETDTNTDAADTENTEETQQSKPPEPSAPVE